MKKTRLIIIVSSIVISLGLVGTAVLVAAGRNSKPIPGQTPVSQTELKAADGKDGNDCLVAVDGTVYRISDFSLWQNGKHTSSDGRAYCGADMSQVINESPHGHHILDVLEKVGPLQN